MNSSPHCYRISAESPFLDPLAHWILEQYGQEPETLARVLVLLPHRRACRALRESFLKINAGKPMLLPRLQPIGEVEDEPLLLYGDQAAKLPPAIDLTRRHLLLTHLVMNFERQRQGRVYDVTQAAELAAQLARFIDEVEREGADFAKLEALAPEELAAHWQQTLDFLKLVSHHWPKLLEEENALDPVTHRNQLLSLVATAWRNSPPDHPIIAAGSTGSQPATANLMSVIARLPQGAIVLPALDADMPEDEWKYLGETHPQFTLKELLIKLKINRNDITPICHPERSVAQSRDLSSVPQARSLDCARDDKLIMLRTILQPPEATSRWRDAKPPLEGLSNLHLLEAETLADEARMIAIALRETLETPEKTAALVTPDRALARMVAAMMQRFSVSLDDSAGRKLADTPAGCFLRLAIEMIASQATPSALLALLRHPFAAAGMAPAECRNLARQLELHLLRDMRKAPGLRMLQNAASEPALKNFLAALEKNAKPLSDLFAQKKAVPLTKLLEAHIVFAEWLASTQDESGEQRLWAGEAGNALATFLSGLSAHANVLEQVDPFSYPALFETLLAGESYWPSYGLHPRLHILSPMEARLQNFDRVILSGLNEGTWPSAATADPWMSRPMRHAFGLISPQRAIGQSAHDFYLLCAAPEVFLTRARKVDGVPTVASRWLVRMKTLLDGIDPAHMQKLNLTKHYTRAIELLDAPLEIDPINAPAPTPPLDARPRKLRVTAIDTWLRDPYIIYAQYILKLRALKPLDQEPDAADFGMVVHDALEGFTRAWPEQLPENTYEELIKYGQLAFSEYIDRPAVACLWWPRFEAMAEWIYATEKERRPNCKAVLAELNGEWTFEINDKKFTLTTRIDRMEISRDGKASIIDYKTGTLPTNAEIERGLANQLPLEALIAELGALLPKPPHEGAIDVLEYWKLAGSIEQSEIKSVPAELIPDACERLMQLITHFDNAATPYKAARDEGRYNDYAHLTRRQEWDAI